MNSIIRGENMLKILINLPKRFLSAVIYVMATVARKWQTWFEVCVDGVDYEQLIYRIDIV